MSYVINGNRVRYEGDGEGHPGYAVEKYERNEHDIKRTTTHRNDGWCPEQDQGVEMKSAKVELANGNPGRFILRQHQHRALREEDRDYVFAVYREVTEDEWEIEADIRLPAREFHDACDVPDSASGWTPRRREYGYYREYAVRWTDLPVLGWHLPERFEDPFRNGDVDLLADFRRWDG